MERYLRVRYGLPTDAVKKQALAGVLLIIGDCLPIGGLVLRVLNHTG